MQNPDEYSIFCNFNPHNPQRVVTDSSIFTVTNTIISIHTTRKGLWRSSFPLPGLLAYFNPHNPQRVVTMPGERETSWHLKFQSTQPAKGCDGKILPFAGAMDIFQSTQPAKGCDCKTQRFHLILTHFPCSNYRKSILFVLFLSKTVKKTSFSTQNKVRIPR